MRYNGNLEREKSVKVSINGEPPFNISGTFEKLLRTILVELEDISEDK